PYRPMFDVVEIVSDAFLRGREARDFAAQIIHLGPAGHTRSDVVAEEVASNGFVIELLSCLHRGNMWPRSDERHFSAEYIDKLRQFVEARRTKVASDLGHSRIVRHCPRRAALVGQRLMHRSEFQDRYQLIVEAEP